MSQNDDTISRQAAMGALDKEYRCTDQTDDWNGLKTAMLIIENLPSAPQRTGHWIPMTYRYVPSENPPYTVIKWMEATEPDDIEGLKCSECGEIYDFTEARNWCSECGVRMRYKDATI